MKKYILLAGVLMLLMVFWGMGQTEWHVHRNRLNTLPQGPLVKTADKVYTDRTGRQWVQQPQSKNQFHQPGETTAAIAKPYEKVVTGLTFDPNTPNWKFLSPTEGGGSHEAILQPNGEYLTTGPRRGTYNYGHPAGLVGTLKHAVYDVVPHFVNTAYAE